MIIDEKGRLFGKVSIIDIVLVIVIIGLGFGFVYKKGAPKAQQVLDSNSKFYVTMVVEKVRDLSVNAIKKDDVFYETHQNILGKAVDVSVEEAYDILIKDDGTAAKVKMDERYNVYVTLECTGSINDKGYYINGNRIITVGNELKVQSNMVTCSMKVVKVSEELED